MPATPKKGRRFGGSAQHQRLMMANLVSSLIAAEGIVTTEAKAKAVRPIAEKMITKAKKGGLHNHRQVVSYLNDKEIAAKLFAAVGPRHAERNGRSTRPLPLGPRPALFIFDSQSGDITGWNPAKGVTAVVAAHSDDAI